MTNTAKKLIEVALPLEAINKASAREKSIRHGHPSTLHLWWARRPLAAARAVIFAQMVDDPSAHSDLFPTEKAQEKERKRLFKIIEELVQWENTNNEQVLQAARDEIRASWRRTCAANADHPQAKELFDRYKLPAFHDPFAGGGSLPLEAQRLGLEAYASDLNPVAVLINKAMIEIPPKFAGLPPVNPEARADQRLVAKEWRGAQGLAEDVRYYGKWMRDEAEKRIGRLYPKVEITAEMAAARPDLKSLVGRKLTVIAWLWARTVKSPNPAFSHVEVPLASTFMLSTKPGTEAYVEPIIDGDGYSFSVKVGAPSDMAAAKRGTKLGSSGSSFFCLLSGTPMPFEYLRSEAKAGRMGTRMMAVVVEGERGRIYLSPTTEMESIALEADPLEVPDVELPEKALGFRIQEYGMAKWSDLFTSRQLVILTTLSNLVQELHGVIAPSDHLPGRYPERNELSQSEDTELYREAISLYLAFSVSRMADRHSTLCRWDPNPSGYAPKIANTFGRQALPMVWDFVEGNPFSPSSGNFLDATNWVAEVIDTSLVTIVQGSAAQFDARTQTWSQHKVVSSDPPYFDNIGYADLSDYFYVWLRRSLKPVFPEVLATVSVPKSDELIASRIRHGSRERAETFFLTGMTDAMKQLACQAHDGFPVTIYYAFKQSESDGSDGTTNTGWDTFLAAVIEAGFAICGTWPMRTELSNRMVGSGTNALASSIVLVCRKRSINAVNATRREFITVLKSELPDALVYLQRSNIAPVDLAQAAIGPGMAVFTRFSQVLDASGSPLAVRDALTLINQVLDETLAEQEGDFDADTRWALSWFEQLGFNEGEYGVAETLSKAKNTSIAGMVEAGILAASKGRVRVLRPEQLPLKWDPATDSRLTAWEAVHHLVRALEEGGEPAAAELVARLGSRADTARELAYRLYNLCERKKRAAEALSYNGLVQSWPEIVRLAETALLRQERLI
jgi:putative DNA methylase